MVTMGNGSREAPPQVADRGSKARRGAVGARLASGRIQKLDGSRENETAATRPSPAERCAPVGGESAPLAAESPAQYRINTTENAISANPSHWRQRIGSFKNSRATNATQITPAAMLKAAICAPV